MPENIVIRKCKKTDARAVYEIRNNPAVRKWSWNRKKMDFAEHQDWFLKKYFGNGKDICFVAVLGGKVVGYCRFDWVDGFFRTAIALLPEYQGRGYGNIILKESLFRFKTGKKIRAEIKSNNKASVALFEKNSFVIYRKIKNIVHLRYKV